MARVWAAARATLPTQEHLQALGSAMPKYAAFWCSEDDQFTMPSGDVEITAQFELKEIYILEDHLYDKEGNQLFNQEYIDENGDSYYFDANGVMVKDAEIVFEP